MIFGDYLYIAHRIDRSKAKRFCRYLSGVVLDAGCGRSPYKNLLPRGCRYIGMDESPALKPDLVGSVLAIPMESGSADAVICNEVLEHVPEPHGALREIHRVLKPGGPVYITVPQSWGLHYEPHDYYRYTKYGITYLLEKNGFSIERLEQMGGLFSFFAVRLIDLIVTGFFFRVFGALGIEKGKYRISALAVLPLNFVLIPAVTLLDKLDFTNAYGWAVLARKQ